MGGGWEWLRGWEEGKGMGQLETKKGWEEGGTTRNEKGWEKRCSSRSFMGEEKGFFF